MDTKSALRRALGSLFLDGNSVARRPIKKVLKHLLADQSGLAIIRVLGGPAKGTRLALDLESEAQYGLGIYDRPEIEYVAKWCRPGMTAYDCGAYIGYYTAVFASIVGESGKVITLEPDPINFARVQQQIDLNRWRQVCLVNLALGQGHTKVEFATGTGAMSHIKGTYRGYEGRVIVTADQTGENSIVEIACVNLDELVFEMGYPRPGFVKIDIEGAEHLALANSHRTGSEVRPMMLLELHNPEGEKAAELWLTTHSYVALDVHSKRQVKTAAEFHAAGAREQCTLFMLPGEKAASLL